MQWAEWAVATAWRHGRPEAGDEWSQVWCGDGNCVVFLGPLHLAVSIYNWFSISTNLLSSVQKVDEINFFTKDTSYSSVYTG